MHRSGRRLPDQIRRQQQNGRTRPAAAGSSEGGVDIVVHALRRDDAPDPFGAGLEQGDVIEFLKGIAIKLRALHLLDERYDRHAGLERFGKWRHQQCRGRTVLSCNHGNAAGSSRITAADVSGQGVNGSCLREGVMFDIGGGVLAFDQRSFPDGQPQPASWADFWDVKAFPGPRALPNIGNPWWAMIAALEADGVSRDALFPLDLDRAFRKLDEIKPHVTVWWKSGDQSQQIFRTREVVMAMLFSGRAFRLRSEGIPLGISWHGAPLDAAFWAATKAARHPNAALALLDFIYTRPKAHAEFAAESFGSTAQRGALDFLPADAKASSVLQPANWSKIVRVDREWLAANREKVLQRWSTWIAS